LSVRASHVRRVVNTMRDRGALLGGAGRNSEVIQVRPPPTFGAEHADLLLQELERTLLALPGAAQ
jgi:4-aminobutyrate aminotransferase-like enzyme